MENFKYSIFKTRLNIKVNISDVNACQKYIYFCKAKPISVPPL